VLGYCIDEVADHTMALLLCIARRIIGARGHTKNGYWDIGQFKPLPALKDCTLGLIGFGDIARAVTARARCFGLSIQTSDPFISGELASRHGAKLVGLEELLSSSDFISIHVPLTDDTRRMLSRREFLMVKPSAVLINTARGPIVDEEALREALNAKRIAFVALDVMAREPPGLDNPLLRMENVVITPHIAWYSEHSAELLGEMTARQILSVFKGYFPEYLVNPEVIELRPDLKQIDLSS